MTLSLQIGIKSIPEDPLRILAIDDDRIILRLMQRCLETAGYTVFTCEDGQKGLQIIKNNRPQLVICDWQMEPINGLDLCRRIKQTTGLENTYFCLLTSRSRIEDRVIGLDAGADDFLCKPLAIDELLARVRSAERLVRANEQQRLLAMRLKQQTERLNKELAQAAEYVHSLLPADVQHPVEIHSRYLPCTELAGDCYDHYWLNSEHLLMYLLDVSGHGLAAALPSISIHNLLRSNALPRQTLVNPASLLSTLNNMFQMERQNCQYFTMWYGIYHAPTRQLTYASGGHPPALCFTPTPDQGFQLKTLSSGGMALGLFKEATYTNQTIDLPANSKLFIYSDGAYELPQAGGLTWSLADFADLISQLHQQQEQSIDALISALRSMSVAGGFRDDCSLIRAHFY